MTAADVNRRKKVLIGAILAGLFLLGVSSWPAPSEASTPAHAKASAVSMAQIRSAAYGWAVSQRGRPYTWGGTGPYGYDCSGLVYASYRRLGVSFGRDTYEMLASGKLTPVSHPQRGDLAFFGPGHVELYDWGNITFGAQEPGTVVWWHRSSRRYHPTAYYRVAGSG